MGNLRADLVLGVTPKFQQSGVPHVLRLLSVDWRYRPVSLKLNYAKLVIDTAVLQQRLPLIVSLRS